MCKAMRRPLAVGLVVLGAFLLLSAAGVANIGTYLGRHWLKPEAAQQMERYLEAMQQRNEVLAKRVPKQAAWGDELLNGSWNAARQQINVVECANLSKDKTTFEFRLRTVNGKPAKTEAYTVDAFSAVHIPIAARKGKGSYAVAPAAEPASKPLLHCFTVVYRFQGSASNSALEYGYAIPAYERFSEESGGLIGALDVEGAVDEVVLTVHNPGSAAGSYELKERDALGEVFASATLQVKPGRVKDVKLKIRDGSYSILPKGGAVYGAYLTRVVKAGGAYTTAYAAPSKRPAGKSGYLLTSSVEDRIEAANLGAEPVAARLKLYDEDGQELEDRELPLEPYATRRVAVGNEDSRYALVMSESGKLVVQSAIRAKNQVYVAQSKEEGDALVGAAFNTNFSVGNTLTAVAAEMPGKLELTTAEQATAVEGFPGVVAADVSALVGADKIGALIVSSDVEPVYAATRRFPAELMRQEQAFVYAVPTVVITDADIPGVELLPPAAPPTLGNDLKPGSGEAGSGASPETGKTPGSGSESGGGTLAPEKGGTLPAVTPTPTPAMPKTAPTVPTRCLTNGNSGDKAYFFGAGTTIIFVRSGGSSTVCLKKGSSGINATVTAGGTRKLISLPNDLKQSLFDTFAADFQKPPFSCQTLTQEQPNFIAASCM